MRNLARFYTSLIKPKGVAKDFVTARQILNEYLDSSLNPKVIVGAKSTRLSAPDFSFPPKPIGIACGREILRRDILDVTIYGHFSHANPNMRKMFKTLFRSQFFYSHILGEFIITLVKMLRIIFYVEGLNWKVLRAK